MMNFSTPASLTQPLEYANTTDGVEENGDNVKSNTASIVTTVILAFLLITSLVMLAVFRNRVCKYCRRVLKNEHYTDVPMIEVPVPKIEIQDWRQASSCSEESGFCSDSIRVLNSTLSIDASSSALATDSHLLIVPKIEIAQNEDENAYHDKVPRGFLLHSSINKRSTQISKSSHLEPKILKVKPLKAAEQNDDKTGPNSTSSNQDVLVNRNLDWNKVFRFLSSTIDVTEWKLFFIHLFSCGQHLLPQGQTINNKIGQIASTSKGSASTLMFDLFEAWLSLMGDEAQPDQIENALRERGNNEALGKFKDFMRDPPLLPIQPVRQNQPDDLNGKQYQLVLRKPSALSLSPEYNYQMHSQTQVMALHDTIQLNNESQRFTRTQTEGDWSNGLVDQAVLMRSQRKYSSNGRHLDISRSSSNSFASKFGGKRSRSDSDCLSSSDDEHSPNKSRKREKVSPSIIKRTSVRRKRAYMDARKCEELVTWGTIDKTFIIELIKRVLPSDSQIFKEEYRLFLHHTVSLVIKKTGESEDTVLSVLVGDFNKTHEYKSERGHVTFILDTENCSLALGENEWENIKLYTEHARSRVVRRLTIEDSDFVASKFLFIDYDGVPIIRKQDVEVLKEYSDAENTTCKTVENSEQTDPVEQSNTTTSMIYSRLGPSNHSEIKEVFPGQSQELLDKSVLTPAKQNVSMKEVNTLNSKTYTTENIETRNNKNAISSVSLNGSERMGISGDKGTETVDADETDINVFNEDTGEYVIGETRDQSTAQEEHTDNIESLIEDISGVIEMLSNDKGAQIIEISKRRTLGICSFEDANRYNCSGVEYVDHKTSVDNFNENAKVTKRRSSI